MKLSSEQIASMLWGSVSHKIDEDGVHPYRFTARQFDAYAKKDPYYPPRARDSAGISVRFLTNSRRLGIRLSFIPDFEWWHQVFADVLCDGEFLGIVGSPDTPAEVFEESFELGKGQHLVEVFFPWSVETVIRAITLDDGSTATPKEKPATLLEFGDSITHGMDAHGPRKSYAARIAAALGMHAINQGVGSDIYFPELPERFDNVGLITVAYGTNDWSHGGKPVRAEIEARVEAFYRRLNECYPEAKIAAISPLWRGDGDRELNGVRFYEIEEIIKNAVAKYPKVRFVSGGALVPHEKEYFTEDLLHPADPGFEKLAEALTPILKEMIGK